jgi:hypothetical protein
LILIKKLIFICCLCPSFFLWCCLYIWESFSISVGQLCSFPTRDPSGRFVFCAAGLGCQSRSVFRLISFARFPFPVTDSSVFKWSTPVVLLVARRLRGRLVHCSAFIFLVRALSYSTRGSGPKSWSQRHGLACPVRFGRRLFRLCLGSVDARPGFL